jgi:hypothetical protein
VEKIDAGEVPNIKSMRFPLSTLSLLALLQLSSVPSTADDTNLVSNSGFEEGKATYTLFVGPESKDANCRFTISPDTFHSGQQSAIMQADDFARFSLCAQVTAPLVAGDVYRVGVWVKAGADFQAQPGSPGVVLRLNPEAGSPVAPVPNGFIFAYANATISMAAPPGFAPLPVAAPDLTSWTHLEAVVKIPDGVDHYVPALFFWRAKGSLYVDDFSFQKVDAGTSLTPTAKQ